MVCVLVLYAVLSVIGFVLVLASSNDVKKLITSPVVLGTISGILFSRFIKGYVG